MLGMDDPAVVVSGDPVFVAVVSGLPVLVAVVSGLPVLVAVVSGLPVLVAVVSGLPVLVAVVSGLPVMVAVVSVLVAVVSALSSSAGADDTKLVTEINPMRTKAKTTLLDIIVVVIQVCFQFFVVISKALVFK